MKYFFMLIQYRGYPEKFVYLGSTQPRNFKNYIRRTLDLRNVDMAGRLDKAPTHSSAANYSLDPILCVSTSPINKEVTSKDPEKTQSHQHRPEAHVDNDLREVAVTDSDRREIPPTVTQFKHKDYKTLGTKPPGAKKSNFSCLWCCLMGLPSLKTNEKTALLESNIRNTTKL